MLNWIDISTSYPEHPDSIPNKFFIELPFGHTLYLERSPTGKDDWYLDGLGLVEHHLGESNLDLAMGEARSIIYDRCQMIARHMQDTLKALSPGGSIEIKVELPDGRFLVASEKRDDGYLGFEIEIRDDDYQIVGTDVAWIEYMEKHHGNPLPPDERIIVSIWNGALPEAGPIAEINYATGDIKEDPFGQLE